MFRSILLSVLLIGSLSTFSTVSAEPSSAANCNLWGPNSSGLGPHKNGGNPPANAKVTAAATTYAPGKAITLTIATPSPGMSGTQIYCEDATQRRVGTFDTTGTNSNGLLVDQGCASIDDNNPWSDGNTFNHNSSNQKPASLQIKWTPDPTASGTVTCTTTAMVAAAAVQGPVYKLAALTIQRDPKAPAPVNPNAAAAAPPAPAPAPAPVPTPTPTPTPSPPSTPVQQTGPITSDVLATHSTPNNCWVAILGDVLDVTQYRTQHPAGPGYFTCGTDNTQGYQGSHGSNKTKYAAVPKMGTLAAAPTTQSPATQTPAPQPPATQTPVQNTTPISSTPTPISTTSPSYSTPYDQTQQVQVVPQQPSSPSNSVSWQAYGGQFSTRSSAESTTFIAGTIVATLFVFGQLFL